MSRSLKIHVGGGFDAVARRVARAWHRAERGRTGRAAAEEHLTFVSWVALAKAMTEKRLELLRRLHRRPAKSVAALARGLRRDYKRVHQDVAALEAAGLIARGRGGLRADYDEIRTVIAL
jgi:predicted transcriptional regulator